MKPIIVAAAGGRRRLVVLPEPILVEPNDGQRQEADSGDLSAPPPSWALALIFLPLVAVLLAWLCCAICKKAEEEETASIGGHDERQPEVQVAVDMVPSGTCSVCLGELDDDDGEALKMLMPCKHYFHTACVDEWLRKSATCPICRAPTVAKPGRRRT
ncbi:unnamed protein product [Urochloa humidicola]